MLWETSSEKVCASLDKDSWGGKWNWQEGVPVDVISSQWRNDKQSCVGQSQEEQGC